MDNIYTEIINRTNIINSTNTESERLKLFYETCEYAQENINNISELLLQQLFYRICKLIICNHMEFTKFLNWINKLPRIKLTKRQKDILLNNKNNKKLLLYITLKFK